MAGVLLILSEMRDGTELVDYAIKQAGESGSELIILSILDPAVLEKAATLMSEQGQVGTRPSLRLTESVAARHEQLARADTAEVVSRAEAASVATRSIVRRGDHVREATKVIREERPDTVMIEKRPRSLLRMRNTHSFLDRLAVELGFDIIEI